MRTSSTSPLSAALQLAQTLRTQSATEGKKAAPAAQSPAAGSSPADSSFENKLPLAGASTSLGLGPAVQSPQTKEAALQRMQSVLDPTPPPGHNKDSENGATITSDAPPVEGFKPTGNMSVGQIVGGSVTSAMRQAEASQQFHDNHALAARSFFKLPPQERTRYETVMKSLMPHNPMAALSMQKMLLSGRLEKGKDLLGQGTLLQHLSDVAQGKGLDKRVNPKQLLNDMVRELATPSATAQGNRGTCAPTSVAIDMNMKNPAEYARLMQGLASDKGEVKTASGQMLRREPDTSFKDDGSGRALTQRLMAPALMEVANLNKNYHDSLSPTDPRAGAGANAQGVDKLSELLTGQDWKAEQVGTQGGPSRQEVMQQLDSQLSKGQSVLAGVQFGSDSKKGHALVVTGEEKHDGKSYVDFTNPWGRTERMSREEFTQRLRRINYAAPSDT